MERQIGEVFTYQGKTYQVVKSIRDDSCAGCAFRSSRCTMSPCLDTRGNCVKRKRKDNNDIIFKEITNMKNNQLTIDIPEGMEIDIENTDLTKGIIKFRPKNVTYYDVEIALNLPGDNTCMVAHKDNLSKLLAISGLMNIAKYYNKGWKPNWNKPAEIKYYIYYSHGDNKYQVSATSCTNCNEIFFRLSSDAQAVIDNPNFRPILDTIYKD